VGESLLLAFGLVLVIEGLMPLLAPAITAVLPSNFLIRSPFSLRA